MSVKVSSWVWHEASDEINGNELILLLALADVADDNGRCRFVGDDEGLTYPALERKARISKSTVVRLVAKLRESGLIAVVKGVKGRPNEFRVLVPWAEKSGANLTPNGDSGSGDSVSSGEDSVSSESTFGVKHNIHSSIDVLNVSTRKERSDAVASDYSDDVVRLSRLLGMLVSQNGHKVGQIGKVWWSACDRLMRLDEYTAEQIEIIIRWSTANEFWSANIRSMPKLREKFSTLRAQRNAELAKRRPSKSDRAADVIEMGRQMEAAAERQAVSA